MSVGRRKKISTKELKKLIPKFEEWGREGLIDSEIAKRLGISLATLYTYKRENPEIYEALDNAKKEADFVVKESLYKKANGFFIEEIEEIRDDEGEVVRTKTTKKYIAPDTKAMQMWLQNREPEEWREKKELNVEQDWVIDVTLGDEEDEN